MTDLAFELHAREAPEETQAIVRGIIAYNERFTSEAHEAVVISAKGADGAVLAGLTGSTSKGWLFVKLLWVHDDLRGRGVGSRLMKEAEEEAVRRGCHSVWLDTFSFQARGFYEKLGYAVFGQLEDYPPGHTRYFLRKRLG